jgi:hypothetical protein
MARDKSQAEERGATGHMIENLCGFSASMAEVKMKHKEF